MTLLPRLTAYAPLKITADQASSHAVRCALARYWTRRAELAEMPEAREQACEKALKALASGRVPRRSEVANDI